MPFITMRLLAEEQRLGTMELLLTAPVRDWELVTGKWLGGFLFLVSLITVTWIYPLILNFLVEPGIDQGILLTGYLGLILLSAAIVAIGVAISSFFDKQIIAAFVTYGVVLLLWFIRAPAQTAEGLGVTILNNINIIQHYLNFFRGVIDLADTVYYLSVTAFGLFLGTISVEMRRWR
jgi:ABC-2 type transport system permease protein